MTAKEVSWLSLYDEECQLLLKQALAQASASSSSTAGQRSNKSRYADSSSDEDESDKEAYSSSSSASDEETPEVAPNLVEEARDSVQETVTTTTTKVAKKKPKKRTKMEMTQRQRELAIQRHFNSLTCEQLPIANNDADRKQVLTVPTALLTKEQIRDETNSNIPQLVYNLSVEVMQHPVIVLSVRSGRFAGAVFQRGKCLVHTTSQRYTIRRGQGKAQSAQDGTSAPKSMGAQLRRHGEVQLQNDIAQALENWSHHINSAALIFVSCPKTMRRQLLVGPLDPSDNSGKNGSGYNTTKIRRVPLDMGRPTFESVSLIHATLMRVSVQEQETNLQPQVETAASIDLQSVARETTATGVTKEKDEEEPVIRELSELHLAARDGDVDKLTSLLPETTANEMNELAGEEWMTPLHLAAQCEAPTAGACVRLLLEQGGANPSILDGRHRVPYYLSSHDKVRQAFRLSRGVLGEERWAWDAGAKVGPALTDDDVQARKDKEAEKRRRKKARQKEKKAAEKEQAAAAEQRRLEAEKERDQAEQAKRVRDGLVPKQAGLKNACDFCGKVVRKKSSMFQRLDYWYCSTDCVQKHKRELMAAAALSRFG